MVKREEIREGVDRILGLRRAEALAAPEARQDIAAARELLERLIGPTVRRADAARLLGISQPALSRWIEKGEIATVVTPEGRREVPIAELLELVDELERGRAEGGARPVARAIEKRRRAAKEAIDLDRLLPRRRPRGHRTAELQALAYHRLVAERLDERTVENARRRLARWRSEGRVDERWIDEWERVLAGPPPRVAEAIGADTPRARRLRQTSPFAGAVPEHERRRLVEAVEARALA